jgi:hypothetical protein
VGIARKRWLPKLGGTLETFIITGHWWLVLCTSRLILLEQENLPSEGWGLVCGIEPVVGLARRFMDTKAFLQEGHAGLINVLEVNRICLSNVKCRLETLLWAQADHAFEVSSWCPLKLSLHDLSDWLHLIIPWRFPACSLVYHAATELLSTALPILRIQLGKLLEDALCANACFFWREYSLISSGVIDAARA